MKINNKIYVLLIASCLVIALGLGLLVWQSQKKTTDPNNPQSDIIVDDKNQPLTDGQPGNKDKVITPAHESTQNSNNIEKPVITRAEQTGDFIRVSATFSNSSSGQCIVKLEKAGSKTYTQSAAIIVGPSYYTCDGFRVPKSALGNTGEWTVSIIHKVSDSEQPSDKVTVNVL